MPEIYSYPLRLSKEDGEALRSVSEQSRYSIAYLLRKFVGHCTQMKNLNEILPNVSGQVTLSR